MDSVVWFLAVFLVVGAIELSGKDDHPKDDLPFARPESLEALKNLLHKAMSSGGTYHRNLLISAGIVEAPTGYEIPKDAVSGSQEISLKPEMQEYFLKHIVEISSSLEKLNFALNRLFRERILPSHFVAQQDSVDLNLVENLKFGGSKSAEPVTKTSDVPNGGHNQPVQHSSEIDCDVEANSRSAACKDIPELLPSLPAFDFVMTTESESTSENEFVTSSIVDEITTEYRNFFTEVPESTVPPYLQDSPLSGQADGVVSYTPLDDDFIMRMMSGSFSYSSTKVYPDETETDFEEETQESTSFVSTSDAVTASSEPEASETEFDSTPTSLENKKILTFEEVQLLDKSLALKPELKYHVISTFRQDLNPVSDVYFSRGDETHSDDKVSSSTSGAKKRKRINPRGISLDDPIFYQAPTPHRMLLRYYRKIPDTSFTCENKPIPGFYADQETDCQVFHVCWPGRRESFLCPVGSLFNQLVLSCDKFNNTNCSLSHFYFDANTAFQEYDDAQARNVTPKPDPLMKPLQNDSGTRAIVTDPADIVELFEADLHFADMVNKTVITELWEYMPVRAKVFIYPEPEELKTFLAQHRHHKVRKSKDVRSQESSTEVEDFETVSEPNDILRKRQRIEANIIRVLTSFARKRHN